jgi:hypothetical protein
MAMPNTFVIDSAPEFSDIWRSVQACEFASTPAQRGFHRELNGGRRHAKPHVHVWPKGGLSRREVDVGPRRGGVAFRSAGWIAHIAGDPHDQERRAARADREESPECVGAAPQRRGDPLADDRHVLAAGDVTGVEVAAAQDRNPHQMEVPIFNYHALSARPKLGVRWRGVSREEDPIPFQAVGSGVCRGCVWRMAELAEISRDGDVLEPAVGRERFAHSLVRGDLARHVAKTRAVECQVRLEHALRVVSVIEPGQKEVTPREHDGRHEQRKRKRDLHYRTAPSNMP